MASIIELIKNIRNARLGKDVRESIASAIEQTYEDASKDGNANMEVAQARGTFSNLSQRLNNSDSSKADKIEVDTMIKSKINQEINTRQNADSDLQNQINGLASGSPLVASSTSEMTDTTRVYVNTTSGHWYYYNGTNWVDGGVYQSTGIGDNSIAWNGFSSDLKTYIKNGTWYNTIKTSGGRYPNKEFIGPFNINDEFLIYPISYSGLHLNTVDVYGLDSNNSVVFTKANVPMNKETIIKLSSNVAKIRVTFALSTAETNTIGEFLLLNLQEKSLVNYIYKNAQITENNYKFVNFLMNKYSQEFTFSTQHNAVIPINLQKDYSYKISVTSESTDTNVYFDIYGNTYSSNPYGRTKLNESIILTAYENSNNVNVWCAGMSGAITFTITIETYSIPKLQNEINKISQLNKTTCKIFKKVVCCGDSYTSGHIVDKNNAAHPTNEEFAFPHYMATLTGNEWINCGSSGASSKTWLTSSRGLAKAISSGKSQAYIIGLMINDQSNSERHVDVGTQADIGTNADTYYGYYSKIIRELNNISPNAKIFIETCPNTNASYTDYNQAVRDIYDYYKNTYPVHLLDLYEYRELYQNVSIVNDLIGGHYTALGYEQFAEILNYILSNYINEHIEDFQDVAFIEYN